MELEDAELEDFAPDDEDPAEAEDPESLLLDEEAPDDDEPDEEPDDEFDDAAGAVALLAPARESVR